METIALPICALVIGAVIAFSAYATRANRKPSGLSPEESRKEREWQNAIK
ncbi:hypothetical protein [Arthrobacter sp. Soil762]|nr:hypothetical protein [Arthrobacter sp. Soil762]